LDIGQAVKRLRSGDKVRRVEWDPEVDDIDPEVAAEDDNLVFTYEDLLADDWEVVEE
jgi:hypothetical protein